MNTQNQTLNHVNPRSTKQGHLLAVLAVVFASYTGQGWAVNDAASKYQDNLLFKPNKSILLAEARGRVNIYDGLENSVVEHVLDTQFARIENMMFVRTRHVQPNGVVEVEEDCDD